MDAPYTKFEKLYHEYVHYLTIVIDEYFQGQFDTFQEDTKQSKWLEKIIVKDNIEKISKYYSYLSFIEEVNKHKFIKEVIMHAKQYGYNLDSYGFDYTKKDMLAIDVALHYNIWGKKTYDNKDFNTLTFSKTMQKGNVTTIHLVLVFLFQVHFTKDDVTKIEPMKWNLVKSNIKQLSETAD